MVWQKQQHTKKKNKKLKLKHLLQQILPVGSPAPDVGKVTVDEVHTIDDGIMAVGVDGDDNCDDAFTQADLCDSTLA